MQVLVLDILVLAWIPFRVTLPLPLNLVVDPGEIPPFFGAAIFCLSYLIPDTEPMGLPYIPPRAESILLPYYLLGSAPISAAAKLIPSVV